MARTVTLANLRTDARRRADMESYSSLTDAEVNRYINSSIAALHSKIVPLCEDDYTTSTTIATVAGTESYSLPAAFLYVRHVEAAINGVKLSFAKWNFAERHRYTQPWASMGAPYTYRLVGADTIRLLPVPTGVYSVTVWYIPATTDLSADGDTYDERDGYAEWVVLDVAIKLRIKEESDVRELVTERAEAWARIAPAHRAKDLGAPSVVQDTQGGLGLAEHDIRPWEWRI